MRIVSIKRSVFDLTEKIVLDKNRERFKAADTAAAIINAEVKTAFN